MYSRDDSLIPAALPKKDRITHRLELSVPPDFNEFAKQSLIRAYQADS